jgi:hypothetical protein
MMKLTFKEEIFGKFHKRILNGLVKGCAGIKRKKHSK